MIHYIKKLIRQGFTYNKILEEIQKTERFSSSELENYKNKKLQAVVEHAYRNVPYYTDLFKSLKLTPEDIKSADDLKKLPFMDKQTARDNFDKLSATNRLKLFAATAHTGGSTGFPGKFYRDYYSINAENAFIWRLWRNSGDNGLKRITLRGDIIVPVTETKPPFWKYNPANTELLMSSYHLADDNAEAFIKKIMGFQPEILYAYPSTATLLARYFEAQNIKLPLKRVFTSSETLSPLQKDRIQEVFECPVTDWYGQAERVAAIAHCNQGSYHIVEDYSVVELVPSEFGLEIVGTSFNNYLMPLLRYKTGDIVISSDENCACGSCFRTVKEIQGRTADYILTPEGSRVTICNHIPRGVANILESQFCQDKRGEVTINLVVNEHFSPSDEAKLIKNTLEHTSPEMKVNINKVSHIPREPNGKFKSIINKLRDGD